MIGSLKLFLKANPNHDHLGRFARAPEGKGGGGEGGASAPARSADIQTKSEAKAYWHKHFDTGTPHAIRCHYGRKSYVFEVRFERNHAYTYDQKKTNRDEDREFNSDRARTMDSIWDVLRDPNSVTWSARERGNKQFDRKVEFLSTGYGRVVLHPEPTEEDIKSGRVKHFVFRSWHPIPDWKYRKSVYEGRRKHVSPDLILKKAIPCGMALFIASRTLSGFSVSASRCRLQRGTPLNCATYLYAGHNRIPEGTGGGTGPQRKYSNPGEGIKDVADMNLSKALDPAPAHPWEETDFDAAAERLWEEKGDAFTAEELAQHLAGRAASDVEDVLYAHPDYAVLPSGQHWLPRRHFLERTNVSRHLPLAIAAVKGTTLPPSIRRRIASQAKDLAAHAFGERSAGRPSPRS